MISTSVYASALAVLWFFDQLLVSPGMKETNQALRKSVVILEIM